MTSQRSNQFVNKFLLEIYEYKKIQALNEFGF